MPLLFCLGQHPALTAVRAELEEGEKLFACLDDLYIVCAPGRVGEVHDLLKRHLWGHSKISIHAGKTKVWNRSGTFPPAYVGLQRAARLACPALSFREETPDSPRTNRGSRCLGVPLGHPDFVEKFLEGKITEHRVLLDRIPEVPDTQSAWLLLSYCAAARANFHLRAVCPQHAQQFAAAHDEGVWQCLCRILRIFPTCGAQEQASLPLREGGAWPPQCSSNTTRSLLGQLGRRNQDGAGAPSGSGKDHIGRSGREF